MESMYIRVNINTFDVEKIKEMEEFYFPTEKDWDIAKIIKAFKAAFEDYICSDFVPVGEIDGNLEGIYYYFNEELLIIAIDGKIVYIGDMGPVEP